MQAEQAQREQDAHEQRLEAAKARQLFLNGKADDERKRSARRSQALDNQRALREQMCEERRGIRLGAGQYGMSEHEKRFNARVTGKVAAGAS